MFAQSNLHTPAAWFIYEITGHFPSGNRHLRRMVRDEDLPEGSLNPVPQVVALLVSAASSRAAAVNMTNQSAAQQIVAATEETVATFLDSDDICPRWPYPGLPPWLAIIASELTLVANTLQEGSLRAGILQIAGQVLDRAQALGTGAAGTKISRACMA